MCLYFYYSISKNYTPEQILLQDTNIYKNQKKLFKVWLVGSALTVNVAHAVEQPTKKLISKKMKGQSSFVSWLLVIYSLIKAVDLSLPFLPNFPDFKP